MNSVVTIKVSFVAVCLCFVFSLSSFASFSDEDLQAISDGFEARRDWGFDQVRSAPLNIAPVEPPLSSGRGMFSRHFSYSIVDFAFKSFWFNQDIEEANDALDINSQFYIDDRKTRNDRDSFYWAADDICRIVEFYGSNGSIAPGRLRQSSEDLILEMMWLYAKENSYVDSLAYVYSVYDSWSWGNMDSDPLPASAEVEQSQTWDVLESENHHIMKFSTLWHFSKLLSQSPDYQNLTFDDGHTPAEHYEAWTQYAKEYCRQRARKGLFLEIADDTYNSHTIKGLYSFHDFADDDGLKSVAGDLLTLYYASWAQEQINGIRGGGKSRMNANKYRRAITQITRFMWYYTGEGDQNAPQHGYWGFLTSDYRLPLVVIDLALDLEGKGNFELFTRQLGLAKDGFYSNPHYMLRTDYGGIVRYSYCTPDFILGLPVVEAAPFTDWTLISSQSRWKGAIFAADINARIVPMCEPIGSNAFNQQRGVQRLGTMITQKLVDYSHNSGDMLVYFSNSNTDMLITEQDGWIFARVPGAFAALRPAWGGYSWDDSDWLRLDDDSAPLIMEVWQSSDFSNVFTLFRHAVLGQTVEVEDGVVTYNGLNNSGEFTFFANTGDVPLIDGEPFDLAPDFTFNSPFINSDWDSDYVTISKDDRVLNLNFNYETFGQEPQYLLGDINKDGVVDIRDFAILAENWLVCTRPNQEDCVDAR